MYRSSERHDPENGIGIGWNKRLSETETTPRKESLLALFLPFPIADPSRGSPRIAHGLLLVSTRAIFKTDPIFFK